MTLDILARRTHFLRNIPRYQWREHECRSLSDFLDALDTGQPELLNAHWNPTHLSRLSELLRGNEAIFGDPETLLKARKPVIAYGNFVTRNQVPHTLAVHGALKEQGLPKETVVASTILKDGNEVVIYRRIHGETYEQVLLRRQFDAFFLLGRAVRAYALAGVALLDEDLMNWMYAENTAIRVDLSALEVPHRFEQGMILFDSQYRGTVYGEIASSIAVVLDGHRVPSLRVIYQRAVNAYLEGLFTGGGLDDIRPRLEQSIAMYTTILEAAEENGVRYCAVLLEVVKGLRDRAR